MKLAIIGSRSFDNYDLLNNEILSLGIIISEVISGGAKGADNLAEKWAINNQIELTIIKPNWSLYGRGAGIKRNEKIINDCDYCIAFWDGKSKGTLSSIKFCEKYSKPHTIVLTKN
jgi:hypothetical protein